MPLQTGAYSVVATNDNGCSEAPTPFGSDPKRQRTRARARLGMKSQPFFKQWNFLLDLPHADSVKLEVFLLNGQLIWSQSWQGKSRIEQQIDGNTWPSGTYWARLSTAKGQWVDQIVKQ